MNREMMEQGNDGAWSKHHGLLALDDTIKKEKHIATDLETWMRPRQGGRTSDSGLREVSRDTH